MPARDPFRDADDEARALARRLVAEVRHGALGVIDPATGAPFVTRIAVVPGEDGAPLALLSDLAPHTRALRADPRASLLLGEPGGRGDPLTHPRLTLAVRATFLAGAEAPRARFLALQPRARLYIDFADFHLVRLAPGAGHLNGGFGRAWRLGAADLGAG
ncbi:MAG: pyridoxamine 5-phosphate oxidase [Rhodobacteraceae bacterium]|nr:pyridoxamine 5-phosphate oxidase [Paracoccaceae bacterium]